jgi:hypothetical protein
VLIITDRNLRHQQRLAGRRRDFQHAELILHETLSIEPGAYRDLTW